MPTYPEGFIGPQLPSGDVQTDPGEYEAFYGTTPQPDESVRYNAGDNTYLQTYDGGSKSSRSQPINYGGDVLGTSTGGYDASAMLSAAGIPSSEKSNLFKQYGVSSTPDLLAAMRAQQEGELARRRKQAGEIGKAWDPIISELDRQVGLLPGRQAEAETRLGELAASQTEGIGIEEARATESLQEEKRKDLRSLEEDIRNALSAAGTYIGAMGAGSSSAAIQASEAVTRQGQKSRGQLMETVASKLSDIKATALKEKNNIQTWKNQKIFETVQFYQDKADQLRTQQANARGERARAIQELIFNLESEFAGRLSQIDNQVLSYATTLEQWERERSAQLQDAARKIAGSATYDKGDFMMVDGVPYMVNPQTGELSVAGGYRPPVSEDDRSYKTFKQDDTTYFYDPAAGPASATDVFGQPLEPAEPGFFQRLFQ